MAHGKSTFAKLLSGILKPKKGEIFLDDENLNKIEEIALRKKIGIVFQNPENQILFNNVKDDMEFTLQNLKLEQVEEKIDKALKQVGMQSYKNVSVYPLSLGQKQRIAIAEVLSMGSKYIILDEPTTMIDSEGKEEIYGILQNLKKQGYTIIYITNNKEEMLLSDRIIMLAEGKIVLDISKQEMLENKQVFKQYGLKLPQLVEMIDIMQTKGIQIDIQEWKWEEFLEKVMQEIKKDKTV